MTKRRAGLIVLAALVGLAVLLPTGVVFYLASSESGLRLIAARVQQIGRVRIASTGVEGTLTGGFRIATLVIDNPWVHLEFTQVEGRAAVLPLLWQTIDLPELRTATALVQVLSPPRRTGGTGRSRVRFTPGALRIDADHLVVAQGTLLLANGTRWDATGAEAAAVVRSREIRVLRGGMELPNLSVQASGRLLAGDPLGLNGQARLNIHNEGLPDWIIHGEFDGDLEELPLTAAITAPFRADFKGRAVDLARRWRWSGVAAVDDFDIRAWGGGAALGAIHGDLALTGDRDGYTAKGRLEPRGLEAGFFDVEGKGSYAQRRVALDDVRLHHIASGARAAVHGAVLLEAAGPRLQLGGDWTNFRWPLLGEDSAVRSPTGRFDLAGVKEYDLKASGELAPGGLPPMPVTMRGLLAGDRLLVQHADVAGYGGTAELRGEAHWANQERWSLSGTAKDIDVAQIRADLPGTLDVDFHAAGRGFSDSGEIDLTVDRIGGRLRGLAARGAGSVERRGAGEARNWTFAGVNLRVGGSQLELDGSTRSPRDLRFDVKSDDLSLLAQRLRGRVTAQGRLSGDDLHPELRLQVQGRGFEWDEDSLQSLDADLDIQLADGGRTRGTLHARQLLVMGRKFEDLQMDLSGTPEANVLGVNLKAEPISMALRARGAFADGRWRGLVDSFDIGDGDNLALRLTEFAPLTLARNAVNLGRACLEGGDARLCLQGEHAEGQWRLASEAHNLPLLAVTAGLSPDTSYEGRVALEFAAHGGSARSTDANLAASLDGALVRHRLPNGREERLALGTGTVAGNLQGETFALRVGLDAAESGRLKGAIEGQRSGPDWENWPVRGSAEVATDALGIIDVFVKGIDRAAGKLTAHVDVAGTLGSPTLQGDLQVRGGELDVYQVNLAVRDLDFDARLRDKSLELDGKLHMGDGTANVDGRIAWTAGVPQGRLAIRGERLRLVSVPEAQILASPNLVFQVDGRRIDVTGEVALPEAHLDPADLTNAVLPSGDEKLVGAAPVDPERQFQVTSNIKLSLGDKVTINTYGLTGRLSGTINTRSDENDISRASGELNVAEGKYTAFGRNLDIERGRLLFNNGLVADPGIDLRAQKVFPDITAGVNVRGTLRAPRMTFFSEPAIPQSQIVSLILAGGSLESVQGSDRRGAARNDLLAQGGAILAQQFGNRVGIEDVGIESDRTNETSLVLGKYLSPRLYVSYGISLAEAINTVKLRYTIGDRWTLKTESGRARSADIVYTIRK
jgi:translocation and assembly module TamB